jgi:hypothetical protein
MSDSVKAYHEMMEEENNTPREHCKYIYVLDYEDGKVYRYDISALCNEDNKWNPQCESCEAFLIGAGHSISNIEWMVVTNLNGDVELGN